MKAIPSHIAGYVGILPGWQAAINGLSCSTCGRAFRGKDRLIRWSATGGFWAWHHWCDMPADALAAAERQEELARPDRERSQAFLEDLASGIDEVIAAEVRR